MTKRKVYGVLFVFMLCFIWGNSMLSQEISGAISHFVAELLGGESGSTDEGHFLVRKLAHLTEYAILGAISYLFLDSLTNDHWRKHLEASLVGVATPLIDETIQIFSGRGPALTDVWIDVLGYSLGAITVFLIFYIAFLRARKNKSSD